jgi:acyl-[acyl-carrier-protein]-phospholipid O-acyltransferase / long-chain-fatty-acid--[acyl-carrier-protein] ligase
MTLSQAPRFSSFFYLNTSQFLAALNDNILKLLIIFLFIHLEGEKNSAEILSTAGIVFVVPFLLFSAFGGTLADRYSKSKIIIATRVFRLITVLVGFLSFVYPNIIADYTVLFIMATFSAIFEPSKYSIIPEIVPQEEISKINGLMTSANFLAIIIGTFVPSFLLQISNNNFLLVFGCVVLITLLELLTALGIEQTSPAGSTKPFRIHFLGEISQSLKVANQYPSLLVSVIGTAIFLFIGGYVQLNVIPFAVQSLHLTDIEGGYLFLLTALGIGVGAVAAGKISGKGIELGLVPFSAIGIAICCYLIYFFASNLSAVITLNILLGLFGGLYQIPLAAFTQVASPRIERGGIIAATNFLSFLGVLLAAGLLYVASEVFHLTAAEGFAMLGTITLIITLWIGYQLFDPLKRFVASLFSKCFRHHLS